MQPATLADCLEVMAAALRAMPAAGQTMVPAVPTQPAGNGRTMGQWLDLHLQAMEQGRGYAEQTLRNKRTLVEHCRRLWGDLPIAQMRPHQVATGLRSFGADQSAIAVRVLSEVRDAFAEAVAAGWVDSNPAAPVKPPKHKVKRHRLTFEQWQQLRALAQASRQGWLESLLLLALVTAQRRGDLAKMRFSDIVGGELRVEQQKEAGKGYGARLAIPLGLRLERIGMTVGDVVRHCRDSAPPGPTLIRQANGQAIEVSSLSNRFAETMKVVLGSADPGPRRRPSLHEVRSLSARLYTAEAQDVQTLLGHKTAEMTALYQDDRGLSAHEWKRVGVLRQPRPHAPAAT